MTEDQAQLSQLVPQLASLTPRDQPFISSSTQKPTTSASAQESMGQNPPLDPAAFISNLTTSLTLTLQTSLDQQFKSFREECTALIASQVAQLSSSIPTDATKKGESTSAKSPEGAKFQKPSQPAPKPTPTVAPKPATAARPTLVFSRRQPQPSPLTKPSPKPTLLTQSKEQQPPKPRRKQVVLVDDPKAQPDLTRTTAPPSNPKEFVSELANPVATQMDERRMREVYAQYIAKHEAIGLDRIRTWSSYNLQETAQKILRQDTLIIKRRKRPELVEMLLVSGSYSVSQLSSMTVQQLGDIVTRARHKMIERQDKKRKRPSTSPATAAALPPPPPSAPSEVAPSEQTSPSTLPVAPPRKKNKRFLNMVYRIRVNPALIQPVSCDLPITMQVIDLCIRGDPRPLRKQFEELQANLTTLRDVKLLTTVINGVTFTVIKSLSVQVFQFLVEGRDPESYALRLIDIVVEPHKNEPRVSQLHGPNYFFIEGMGPFFEGIPRQENIQVDKELLKLKMELVKAPT